MAQVPGSEAVQRVGLTNTRDIVAVPRDVSLEAEERTAGAVVRVVETLADQQNQVAAARADMQAARALEDIRQRYETDDDWMSAPDRARTEAQVVLQTHGATLRGGASQRAWAERSQERLLSFEGTMRTQSRARGVSLARADIVRFGDEAEETAGDLTRTEDERRGAIESFAGLLDRYEEGGLLDPDQSAELESRFTQGVRRRVGQGLEAEYRQRIDMDPDDLAAEIEEADGDWQAVDANVRAGWVREARQAGASAAINDALEETVRTGTIIGEDDERLADRWQYLGEGARLQYAERASAAQRTNRAAVALGELSGLSLAEIAARADQADDAGGGAEGGWTGPAARAHLQAARSDPAAYVNSTQTTVSLARDRLRQARQAAAAENAPAEAASNAQEAAYAYGLAVLQMQDAIGVPPGRQRLYERQTVEAWARRTRARPADQQMATVEGLGEQLLEYWGDEDLAARALQEHLEAYAVAQPIAGFAAPDSPQRAASGASYNSVRGQLLQVLRIGAGLDSPEIDRLVNSLSPADQSRLMSDPEIARATGAPLEDGQ